jgi:hypothetical protein
MLFATSNLMNSTPDHLDSAPLGELDFRAPST